jgi:hypothetical protein
MVSEAPLHSQIKDDHSLPTQVHGLQCMELTSTLPENLDDVEYTRFTSDINK